MRILDQFQIDAVQFPFNVMDTRFVNKKVLSRLQDKSIKIYLRSIFLQGKLIDNSFSRFKDLNKVNTYVKNHNLTRLRNF